MKLITLFAVAAIIALTSCSKSDGGIGVDVGVGPFMIHIGRYNNGAQYQYYQSGVPFGTTQFAGYIQGGISDPTAIRVYDQNGQPMRYSYYDSYNRINTMNVVASSTSITAGNPNAGRFFDWLQTQSSSTWIPVGITVLPHAENTTFVINAVE